MTKLTHYDILLAGSGLSGLTLAIELSRRPHFQEKKILLLDRDEKRRNDRTWCFWATDDEPLPPVLYKSWDKCLFWGEHSSIALDMGHYRYHMVRGLDFYTWAKAELAKSPHVHQLKANILHIDSALGRVRTDQGDFSAEWILNSALTKMPLLPPSSPLYPTPPLTHDPSPAAQHPVRPSDHHTWLLQHFKGWLIETPRPAFDPDVVTFMDYRLAQKGDTRFVYVLPFSPTRALVEFTAFSPALYPTDEYNEQLRHYLDTFLHIQDFQIVEEEFGVIPMTDYPFEPLTEGHVIHIGTVGGFVKPSSGYAFKRTQRKLRAFVDDWAQHGRPNPKILRSARRFRFFDSVMLRALHEGAVTGRDFFTLLFQKLPAREVFRFLDEDASPLQHARIATAPPTWPFFKTAMKQIFQNRSATLPSPKQEEKPASQSIQSPPANCLRVGITGGIGSGKSTVCEIFKSLGIPIFYADLSAKQLLNTDPVLRAGVIDLFGSEAYTPEGAYDRQAVARLAFSNPKKLAALNALVHPAVEVASRAWHQQQAQPGLPYTLKEAALMIESGSHQYLDRLIVVTAPEALRIQRVMQRDGLTEEQVRARIRGQLPEEEKLQRADFVVENDGEHLLVPQVMAIHKTLLSLSKQ